MTIEPIREDTPDSTWIAADWPAPDNIVAGTTTRAHAAGELPVTGEPCWLNQVHGNGVVDAIAYESPPDADASVSLTGDRICVVKTADCLPVLFCTRDGGKLAAAHAGWRGMAAGVIENTLQKLNEPGMNVLVWLGPAISQPAFEVGDEVREAFLQRSADADDCFVVNDRGRWQADLYALARKILATAGVASVTGGDFCTYRDETRFYSYRRAKGEGRLLSFVSRKRP